MYCIIKVGIRLRKNLLIPAQSSHFQSLIPYFKVIENRLHLLPFQLREEDYAISQCLCCNLLFVMGAGFFIQA